MKKINEFIQLADIVRNKHPLLGRIVLGKTKASLLLGPLVDKNMCLHCLYLRLISSDTVSVSQYKRITAEDLLIINRLLQNNTLKKKIIIEFERNISNIWFIKKKHFLLSVPGCLHAYEKPGC